MTHTLIKQISDEAHEILENVRNCQELTWGQRDEIIGLLFADANRNLQLARGLLYDWTGIRMTGDEPLA